MKLKNVLTLSRPSYWFRALVLWAARFAPFRALSQVLFRLAHHGCVESLKSHPDILSMKVRRPAVLQDSIPWESQLDLTLIVRRTLLEAPEGPSLSETVQGVNRWIPILGDVWVVKEENWAAHRELHSFDYFDQRDLSPSPVSRAAQRRQKWREGLLYGVQRRWNQEFGGKRFPSLCLSRRIMKLETQLDAIIRETPAIPTYSPHYKRLNRKERLRQCDELLARLSAPELSLFEGPRVVLRSVGERKQQDPRVIRALQGILKPVLDEFPLCEAFFFPLRPGQFQNALLVVTPNAMESKQALLEALHGLTPQLQICGSGLTPPFPVVFSDNEFAVFRSLDPLANLFFESACTELKTGQCIRSDRQEFKVRAADLIHELAETLDLIDICLRGQDTSDLLDLTETCVVLRQALATGEFPLSLQIPELELLPPALEAKYLDGDLLGVERFPAEKAWKLFEPLCKTLRSFLSEGLVRERESDEFRTHHRLDGHKSERSLLKLVGNRDLESAPSGPNDLLH